jgi:hypothetical protein
MLREGRGIGEIGITGTVAAVANAVYNATGIRVRDLLRPQLKAGSRSMNLSSVVG